MGGARAIDKEGGPVGRVSRKETAVTSRSPSAINDAGPVGSASRSASAIGEEGPLESASVQVIDEKGPVGSVSRRSSVVDGKSPVRGAPMLSEEGEVGGASISASVITN